ncbi:MAG: hypothetical protein ACKPKO_50140, partial [Candidatus Fonsibacter sp.]
MLMMVQLLLQSLCDTNCCHLRLEITIIAASRFIVPARVGDGPRSIPVPRAMFAVSGMAQQFVQ